VDDTDGCGPHRLDGDSLLAVKTVQTAPVDVYLFNSADWRAGQA